jgi:hypothetical protein
MFICFWLATMLNILSSTPKVIDINHGLQLWLPTPHTNHILSRGRRGRHNATKHILPSKYGKRIHTWKKIWSRLSIPLLQNRYRTSHLYPHLDKWSQVERLYIYIYTYTTRNLVFSNNNLSLLIVYKSSLKVISDDTSLPICPCKKMDILAH